MEDESDTFLFERFLSSGCEQSFSNLVQHHLPLVHSIAHRVTQNSEDAKDVAQQVFLKLFQTRTNIPSSLPLAVWLHRITKTTASNYVRSEERRKKRQRLSMEEQNKNHDLLWEQISPTIDDLVHRLPESSRAAVILRFYGGKSHVEIGNDLGISEEAARKRIKRSLLHLEKIFAKKGITTTASFLGTALSTYAVSPSPINLSPSITKAVLATSSTIPTVTTSLTTLITMKALTKATIITGTLLLVGTAGYTARIVKEKHHSNKVIESATSRHNTSNQRSTSQTQNHLNPSKTKEATASTKRPKGIDSETWYMAGAFANAWFESLPQQMIPETALPTESELTNLARMTDYNESTLNKIKELVSLQKKEWHDLAADLSMRLEHHKPFMQKKLAYQMHERKNGALSSRMQKDYQAFSQKATENSELFHKQQREFAETAQLTIESKWYENKELLSSIAKELSDEEAQIFTSFAKQTKEIALEGWAFTRSQKLAEALHLNEHDRQAVYEELYAHEHESEAIITTVLSNEQYEAYQHFLKNETEHPLETTITTDTTKLDRVKF